MTSPRRYRRFAQTLFLVAASSFGGARDTTLHFAGGQGTPVNLRWQVDGATVSVRLQGARDTLPRARYSLTASDSLGLMPGSGADSTFLSVSGGAGAGVFKSVTATFHDSVWWKVRGKTASWAMEIDSTYFRGATSANGVDSLAIHVHWTPVRTAIPWVRWVDTIATWIVDSGTMGPPVRTSLLRWTGTGTHRIDSAWANFAFRGGRMETYDFKVRPEVELELDTGTATSPFYSLHGWTPWLSGNTIYPASSIVPTWVVRGRPDSVASPAGARLWSLARSASDTGTKHPFMRLSPTLGFAAQYLMVPAPFNPEAWRRFDVVWSFRSEGIADSVIVRGAYPYRWWWEGVLPRVGSNGFSSRRAVAPDGRAILLDRAYEPGLHLVPVEGRIQAVFVPSH